MFVKIYLNISTPLINIMTYKYEQPTPNLVTLEEYFESKGYDIKVTDVEDGTVIFIKEKKK